MDKTSIAITIIGCVLTILSFGIAFMTFYLNRKKDSSSDGEWRGELKSDLKHIREGVDELKTNTSQMRNEMGEMKLEIHDVKKSVAAAHQRIDDMQKKGDTICG